MTATDAPALPVDLVAGLKRLKLAKVRAIAPDVLHTARTQRWNPKTSSGCSSKRFLPTFLVSFVLPGLALSLRPE
jgi:uncharacterized membrane protein YadS